MNEVIFTGVVREKPQIESVSPLRINFDVYIEVEKDEKLKKVRVPCFSSKDYAEKIIKMNPSRDAVVMVEGFMYTRKVQKNENTRFMEMVVYVRRMRRWKELR